MTNLHIQSVRTPFDDPRLACAAIGALTRADAMGLLSRPVTCLDDSAIQGLETEMAEAGIGRNFLAELHRLPCSDAARLSSLLEKINEALDQSPAPAHEWRALQGVLGVDLLTRLLGISQSSVRRYISASRSTPDAIAARLHFLAFVVGDLAGAYNDIGVRRWFDRPRERLDGRTPAQVLGHEWSPGTMRRSGCASSPGRWHRPRQRDRLPPRRSPLSLSAGRLVAIRRPLERTWRFDPLVLRSSSRPRTASPPCRSRGRS